MQGTTQRRRPRVRLLLLVLLWIWAACVFLVLDLFLNVETLDAVRPRSGLYRGMRIAAHKMVGEPIVDDDTEPGETGGMAAADEEARVREQARRWWTARLDKERAGFVAKRGLDPTRPRAESPIRWRYVTFAEATAAAAREGKSLFVDVGALWSPWCHRMDYYTYPDAEVTALLNERFIPVKILQEQDRGQDYVRLRSELGAEGVPALGVWSPDGKLRKSLGGWTKPQEFATRLEAALRQ